MFDKETQKNPLTGQALSMDDYENGNTQTIAIMDKIFMTFSFTQDFERVYKRALFTVVHLKTGEIEEYKEAFSCRTYHSKNGATTYFSIDFSTPLPYGYYSDKRPLEKKNENGTIAVCQTHFLAIGPKDYHSTHWQDKAKILDAMGFSLSIIDNAPENDSFFVTKDGRKLSGPCRAEDIIEGQLQFNDPDSLVLCATKDGTSHLFKYSYIPFNALNLSDK